MSLLQQFLKPLKALLECRTISDLYEKNGAKAPFWVIVLTVLTARAGNRLP